MHLVIGGRGLLGSAVVKELQDRGEKFRASCRRKEDLHPWEFYLDLTDLSSLDDCYYRCVFLIAALTRLAECEKHFEYSHQVNVDAPIELAQRFSRSFGAFIVYISSDAVQWPGLTTYAKQKAQVEGYMRTIHGCIVRPSKVNADTVGPLANIIVDAGVERRSGVVRWP